MYLEGGHAYVYFTYGMHWCVNVVTQEADVAEAVLLRGAEPVQGIEAMRKRRPKAKRDRDLMNGPGKLCAALSIDENLDGARLDGDLLWLEEGNMAEEEIAISARIGVENSGEAAWWPLRFYVRGNEFASRRTG